MSKKISSLAWILCLFLAVLVFNSCRTETKTDTDGVKATGPVVVTSRLRGNPDVLNPYRSSSALSRYVFRHTFPTLVYYDPKTEKISPMLAKAVPEAVPITSGPWKGGATFTYEIHDEAVWDNGSPVQATDYIFTMKVINNPKITGVTALYRDVLSFIRDVKIDAENPRKFTVYTDKPYLDSYAATGAWIYPEYAYDPKGLMKDFSLTELSDGKKAEALAAKDNRLEEFAVEFMDIKYAQDKDFISNCGAYALEEWVPTQSLRLKKKENWWGNNLADKYPLLSAIPEEIIFKIVPDQNAAVAMIKEGKLDVVGAIPSNMFLELKENEIVKNQYNFFTPSTYVYNFIGMNGSSPKLKEKAVRKALAHLLDLDGIVNEVYLGMATKIAGPWGAYEYGNKDIKAVPFNVEKAITLLEENNWKDTDGNGIRDKMVNGEKVELDFEYAITPGNNTSSNIALFFKEATKKAGINIEVVTKEFNILRQSFRTKDFELASSAHALEPNFYDPYQHWHSESRSNYFSFGNAESDALIMDIRETMDIAERTKLYHKLEAIICEEQPILFVNRATERIVIHKKFKNAFATSIKPGFFEHYFHY